jgi:hypothetical protein
MPSSKILDRLVQAESLLKQAQNLLGEQPLVFVINEEQIALDMLTGEIDDTRRKLECVLIEREAILQHTDAECMTTVPCCPTQAHK